MHAKRLWDKDLPLDQVIHRFTVGNDPELDLRLMPYDVLGTAAHVRMLGRIGILGASETEAVVKELQTLLALHGQGALTISTEQEDCHTAIEQALTASLGDTGKKIHIGRSRNDQVILALRLYMREQLFELGLAVAGLARSFIAFSREHEHYVMPGYTHMRRAMPSSFGIWGIAFAEALIEELEALQAVYRRLDRCPLGSGAGFGVPLAIDRRYVAEMLGFAKVQRSVADVQNSRGRHELALVAWVSCVGNVLEKCFWDLALFSTDEFGFVALPDEFTTGSSIMPQKRNPDVIELLRGRCAVLRSLRTELENVSIGLPSSYHRDLQLQKEPLVRSITLGLEMLDVANRLVPAVKVTREACARACSSGIYATQEAYKRTLAGGTTFRDAYLAVGREVLSGSFSPDAEAVIGRHEGGAGRLEIERAEEELKQLELWLSQTRDGVRAKCAQTLPGWPG